MCAGCVACVYTQVLDTSSTVVAKIVHSIFGKSGALQTVFYHTTSTTNGTRNSATKTVMDCTSCTKEISLSWAAAIQQKGQG